MKGSSSHTSRAGELRTSAPGFVRYLAFLLPLLGAAAFAHNAPLFRSDEAVLAALAQSQSWSGGLSTLIGRAALALPLGSLNYRLALPSMIGCGLVGLACFELAYSLFRAQGGYSRLDPWLAWGASLAGALSLPAAAEATVAGGATIAPAIALFLCAQLIARRHPRGLSDAALWGGTFGALLSESAHTALLFGLAALVLWPDTKAGRRVTQKQRLPFEKSVVFSLSAGASLGLIALRNDWFSRSWSFQEQVSHSVAGLRPLAWSSAIGLLWLLAALVALIFALRDRRPLYVLALIAGADWLWPSGGELGWTAQSHATLSRDSLHLFALGYLSAGGALGMRTFGETAQAIGLLGARQLSILISVVAVAGSLAAAEDSLMTLSQTEAQGAEAWSEEALQSLPPRALVITESATRGRRLRAAQLQGTRPDVLVVPLSELTQARNVRRWLKEEPELHLLLVDLSLGNPPSERALARLVDARPVFVEPNLNWDRRLLEHIQPTLPLSRLASHALARSDRLAALELAPEVVKRIKGRARAGMRPDRATLDVVEGDRRKLHQTLKLIDRVAASRVDELSQVGEPEALEIISAQSKPDRVAHAKSK